MPSITYNRFEGGLDLRQGSSVADANRLRVLKNAYVTTGKAIKKRPGLVFEAEFDGPTLPEYTKHGLFAMQGKLTTFYTAPVPPTPHPDPEPDSRFASFYVFNPAGAYLMTGIVFAESYAGEVALGFETNSYPFVCIEWGTNWSGSGSAPYARTCHFLGDGAVYQVPSQPVSVSDFNHNYPVIKKSNRMWLTSLDKENVFFCALKDARTWGIAPSTGADAGFLGVASEQSGSSQVTALGEYGSKLVVFFADSAQIWAVDPDQTLNRLEQIIPIGTKHPYAHVTVGNDILFLSPQGVRSISSTSDVVANLVETDVGSPVDAAITDIFGSNSPKAIYYRNGGQAWFYYGTKALVYTFSRTAKINAWSVYEFPVSLDYVTQLDGTLYIRSGNTVYSLSDTAYTDYGEPIDVEIELPFLDFKMAGVLKQVLSMDVVFSGTANVQHRFDPKEPTLITPELSLDGDTRSRRLIPVELLAVNIAPVITHSANEAFELQALTYYFESLGITP